MSQRMIGMKFESRVCEMLRKLGKSNLKRNVKLKDRYGNISEIDGTRPTQGAGKSTSNIFFFFSVVNVFLLLK